MKTLGIIIGAVLLLLTTASVIAWSAWGGGPSRHVVMTARDMAFYVKGQNEPNPTLTLPTDARVTIEFRNEDPGIIHDLLIEKFDDARTKPLAKGESERLIFRTPERPRTVEYICTLHGQMMRGRIEFE